MRYEDRLTEENNALRRAAIALLAVAHMNGYSRQKECDGVREALGGYCGRCDNDENGKLITPCGRKDCKR